MRKTRTVFITATDTGAGKTVVATLLARHWREQGNCVAAFKPVCSGPRGDAHALRAALGGLLTLDQINPWHFQAPWAPLLAARAERRQVRLADVLRSVRELQRRFPFLIVEGAGGLLSPLGEDFDSRQLIQSLQAAPVVVAPNRLGVINQVLLTFAALPRGQAPQARLVLISPPHPEPTSRGNVEYLTARLGRQRVYPLPWMKSLDPGAAGVRRLLTALTRSWPG